MSAIPKRTGFTIVELLIVIVIIAILAAITLVAFNGMQQRARTSDASAGASQAKKKLEVYKIDNSGYPTTANFATSGIVSDPASYQYTSNGTTYCATKTSGNVSYKVSDTTDPSPGGCAGHAQGDRPLLTNLVPNPSFETNSASWGWANGGGYSGSVSNVRAQSGNNSFMLTGGSTQSDYYLELYINNPPAGAYTYSSYVYLTGNGPTNGGRRSWFHCSSGTCSTSAEPNYDTGILNQWQRLQKTVTVTSTPSLRIRFYVPDNSTMYVDSVMVTNGTTVYSYADGNSTDWAWTGAVNNSTSSGPTP